MAIDPRLHLSRRVGRFEQSDDARIRFHGREYVIQLKLFDGRLLGRKSGPELLHDSDDVRLFEQFSDRRQFDVHFGFLKVGDGELRTP